ncbi:bifunctional 4-hydroxy-2-oxoglutarate aldolase/2-dehydro-3-deoxy-phosphogluconate aldolase [Candidatus Poriferisodalis sp.]|uniref:bifunctional 4-hydroxy-2-oxoglutarate aldolase/2-dehydro-3-deoxy-phosphogluconate aldolase n=1 Tax=Candidatus Poriferisodalis sp. TaxID=3101277 RepID=UPI003B028A47
MSTEREVITAIRGDGVVPVYSHADLSVVKEVATAVARGGLSTFEFTVRGAGADVVGSRFIAWARSHLPQLAVGVGTVLDEITAARMVSEGAAYVFAPSFSAMVAAVCHRADVLYVPGCGTMTEIQTAYDAGCEMVKLFPASAMGGPAFLDAVRGPCPWIEAIPSGGVQPTVESLKGWYEAGAPAVGMGSKLFAKSAINSRDWPGITCTVAEVVEAVATARAG